jgi:hypothetical protein
MHNSTRSDPIEVVPRFNPPHQWGNERRQRPDPSRLRPSDPQVLKPDELSRLAESMDFSG